MGAGRRGAAPRAPTHLLGQPGHIHRLDLAQRRQLLQPLAGLLLHGDDERILNVTALRQVQR